jgi:hypothetical protein
VEHTEILSDLTSSEEVKTGFFEPALAWLAIFALIVVTVVGCLGGAGKIMNLLFPFASFAVGLYLYFRAPILYNGFTWWIWFLVAFIRRIADFRSGYTDSSPMLLAPFLVTGISLITVYKYLPRARQLGALPFATAMAGTLYGYLIGLINIPSAFTVTREFLDWLPPVAFGFHLLANWRDFPKYYKNTQRVFVYGTLVTGLYGVYQYVANPGWDVLWMLNSGQGIADGYDSNNSANTFGIRVFSTMQSVEPFSAFMAAGLLMLFADRGYLRFPIALSGYLAFLLSMARSAWMGWFGGVIVMVGSLKAKYQMRLFAIIIAMTLLIVPVVTLGPFSEKLAIRFQTLSNVKEDNSFSARQELLAATFEKNLFNVLGSGIGLGNSDSAILSMLYSLGWIGVIGYVGGLIVLLFQLFQNAAGGSNLFISTARAIIATCLIRLPVNGTAVTGVGGVILWGFLGMTIASKHYYHDRSRTDRLAPAIGDKVDDDD